MSQSQQEQQRSRRKGRVVMDIGDLKTIVRPEELEPSPVGGLQVGSDVAEQATAAGNGFFDLENIEDDPVFMVQQEDKTTTHVENATHEEDATTTATEVEVETETDPIMAAKQSSITIPSTSDTPIDMDLDEAAPKDRIDLGHLNTDVEMTTTTTATKEKKLQQTKGSNTSYRNRNIMREAWRTKWRDKMAATAALASAPPSSEPPQLVDEEAEANAFEKKVMADLWDNILAHEEREIMALLDAEIRLAENPQGPYAKMTLIFPKFLPPVTTITTSQVAAAAAITTPAVVDAATTTPAEAVTTATMTTTTKEAEVTTATPTTTTNTTKEAEVTTATPTTTTNKTKEAEVTTATPTTTTNTTKEAEVTTATPTTTTNTTKEAEVTPDHLSPSNQLEPFITQSDVDFLLRNFRAMKNNNNNKTSNKCKLTASLEPIARSFQSIMLVARAESKEVLEEFAEGLYHWRINRIRSFNCSILRQTGIELSVEIDTSQKFGASLIYSSTGLMLSMPNEEMRKTGQLARLLGPHILDRGAMLLRANQKPYSDLPSFITDYQAAKGEKWVVDLCVDPCADLSAVPSSARIQPSPIPLPAAAALDSTSDSSVVATTTAASEKQGEVIDKSIANNNNNNNNKPAETLPPASSTTNHDESATATTTVQPPVSTTKTASPRELNPSSSTPTSAIVQVKDTATNNASTPQTPPTNTTKQLNPFSSTGSVASTDSTSDPTWKRLYCKTREKLVKEGIEVYLELDTNDKLGAKLELFDSKPGGLAIRVNTPTKPQPRIAQIVGSFFFNTVACLLNVEGKPCTTITEFQAAWIKCKEAKKKIAFDILASPDVDLSGLQKSYLRMPPRRRINGEPMEDLWLSSTFSTSNTNTTAQASSDDSRYILGATSSDGNMELVTSNDVAMDDSLHEAATSKAVEHYENFQYFRRKYKEAISLEFQGSGIHISFVAGKMWDKHRTLPSFGANCSETCNCVYHMGDLSSGVVEAYITKVAKSANKKNPVQWENHLNLRKDTMPAGFMTNFAKKFFPLLKEQYPKENGDMLLARLTKMWEKHRSTMCFGLKCADSCDCEQGWSLVFKEGFLEKDNKNATKPDALRSTAVNNKRLRAEDESAAADAPRNSSTVPRKIQRRSSSDTMDGSRILDNMAPKVNTSSTAEDKPKSKGIPRKPKPNNSSNSLVANMTSGENKEYAFSFKADQPLGLFSITDSELCECSITSVDPNGQAKDRVQPGDKVIGAVLGGERREVKSHLDLRTIYFQARFRKLALIICFVSNKSSAMASSSSSLPNDTEQWTSVGVWCGSEAYGWAGGAQNSAALAQQAAKANPSIAQGNSKTENQMQGISESSEKATEWETVISQKSLVTSKETKSILSKGNKKRELNGARIKFTDSFEERRYVIGSRTTEFLVLSENRDGNANDAQNDHVPVVHLDDAIVDKDVATVVQLLNDGAASEMSKDVLQPLRDDLKSRESTLHQDDPEVKLIQKKDKLLKIYITAEHAIKLTKTLKNWVSFDICIEGVKGIPPSASDGLVDSEVFIYVEPVAVLDRTTESLKLLKVPLSDNASIIEDNLYRMKHNSQGAMAGRVLDVRVLVGRDRPERLLGTARIAMSHLYMSCSQDYGRWYSETVEVEPPLNTSLLPTITVKIRARRQNPDQDWLNKKRGEAVTITKRAIEWIERFNDDISTDEKRNGPLTGNVRVGGLSLLHTAVLLEDITLVDKLLRLGADPSAKSDRAGSALSLAVTLTEGHVKNEDDDTKENARRRRLVAIKELLCSREKTDEDAAGEVETGSNAEIKNLTDPTDGLTAETKTSDSSDQKADSINHGSKSPPHIDDSTSLLYDDLPSTENKVNGEQDIPVGTDLSLVNKNREADGTLPFLENVSWAVPLQMDSSQRCKYFDQKGFCFNRLKGCRFIHVQHAWGDQMGALLEKWSNNNGIDSIATAFAQGLIPFSPEKVDGNCKWIIYTSSSGKTWYTAAYSTITDEFMRDVIYAEGGEFGRQSGQGVWWYPKESEALKALKQVILVTFLEGRPESRKRKLNHESSQPNDGQPRQQNSSRLLTFLVPILESNWLQTPSQRRCFKFDNGFCAFGHKCMYWHVHPPLGDLLSTPCTKLGFRASGETFKNHVQYRQATDSKGQQIWHTAGYRDDEGKLIFYVEGGRKGRISSQGVWWYPTERDAEENLRKVITVADLQTPTKL